MPKRHRTARSLPGQTGTRRGGAVRGSRRRAATGARRRTGEPRRSTNGVTRTWDVSEPPGCRTEDTVPTGMPEGYAATSSPLVTTGVAAARGARLGDVLQLQGDRPRPGPGPRPRCRPRSGPRRRISGRSPAGRRRCCGPAEMTEPTRPAPETTGIPTPTPSEVPRSISIGEVEIGRRRGDHLGQDLGDPVDEGKVLLRSQLVELLLGPAATRAAGGGAGRPRAAAAGSRRGLPRSRPCRQRGCPTGCKTAAMTRWTGDDDVSPRRCGPSRSTWRASPL